jgi:hypothetical protein
MDDPSVLDALLDSPVVPLTDKRVLGLVNVWLRGVVATYFGGELKVVYLHLTDCRLFNVEFLLHELFPKNYNLTLAAHREKLMPELNLGGVKETLQEKGLNYAWPLVATEDGRAVRKMGYTTAYFLGHMLVSHCQVFHPFVQGFTNDLRADLCDSDNVGIYKRFTANGFDAERAVLHCTMLRTAVRAARMPQTIALLGGGDEDGDGDEFHDIDLSNMGLNKDIMRRVAPILHESAKSYCVTSMALDNNPIAERSARALFGTGATWLDLMTLSLDNTGIGDAGCKHLFNTIADDNMPELICLGLENVDMDEEGLWALWRAAPKLRNLERLDISNNLFGPNGLVMLSAGQGPLLPSLEEMNMGNSPNLEHKVNADRMISRALLAGRFPKLNKFHFPVGWEGVPRCLKVFFRERSCRRRRKRLEEWLVAPEDARVPGGNPW